MSHTPADAVLRALLARRNRREITPEGCSDLSSCLDLAALEEGTLSTEGIHRLAHHIAVCDSCKILFAILIDDAHQVEATGKHEPEPLPTVRAPRARSEERKR